jgi:hypothetical protein
VDEWLDTEGVTKYTLITPSYFLAASSNCFPAGLLGYFSTSYLAYGRALLFCFCSRQKMFRAYRKSYLPVSANGSNNHYAILFNGKRTNIHFVRYCVCSEINLTLTLSMHDYNPLG